MFSLDTEEHVSLIKKRKIHLPWVDKYRPKRITDVVYQDEAIKLLKQVIKTGNLPHLLLYGPPGTGKTSTILAVANELFGKDSVEDRVIELNASDERGINTARKKIKTFARMAISEQDQDYPFKIIILDEADAMTAEAQTALRKIIEKYSRITRFCFICNYINQIIEPIASRCVKVRFKPITEKSMYDRIKFISDREKFPIEAKMLSEISIYSCGDMRKGIMILQNLQYIYNIKGTVVLDDVYDVIGKIPDKIIRITLKICKKRSDNIKEILELCNIIGRRGYSIKTFLIQLKDLVIFDTQAKESDEKKIALFTMVLAHIEKMLNEGSDEHIQLLHMLITLKGLLTDQITLDDVYKRITYDKIELE